MPQSSEDSRSGSPPTPRPLPTTALLAADGPRPAWDDIEERCRELARHFATLTPEQLSPGEVAALHQILVRLIEEWSSLQELVRRLRDGVPSRDVLEAFESLERQAPAGARSDFDPATARPPAKPPPPPDAAGSTDEPATSKKPATTERLPTSEGPPTTVAAAGRSPSPPPAESRPPLRAVRVVRKEGSPAPVSRSLPVRPASPTTGPRAERPARVTRPEPPRAVAASAQRAEAPGNESAAEGATTRLHGLLGELVSLLKTKLAEESREARRPHDPIPPELTAEIAREVAGNLRQEVIARVRGEVARSNREREPREEGSGPGKLGALLRGVKGGGRRGGSHGKERRIPLDDIAGFIDQITRTNWAGGKDR